MTEPAPSSEHADWQARRRDGADRKAEALEKHRAAESQRARVMIREFVEAARAASLPTQHLMARGYDGNGRYRTDVVGWYLRRDHSIGIGANGEFYVMTVQPSWWGRIVGAEVPPRDPPLILGAGGRDGESMPLQEILRKRLEEGVHWS
jgi:hypothetical protein